MSDWESVEAQGILLPKEVRQQIGTPIERQLMDSVQHLENELNDWKRMSVAMTDLNTFDHKMRQYVTDTVNAAAKLLEETINTEVNRMAQMLKEVLAQELCEVIDEMMSDE